MRDGSVDARRPGRASAARSAVVGARVPGGRAGAGVRSSRRCGRSTRCRATCRVRSRRSSAARPRSRRSPSLVRQSSLVTLTGVGGVGKTRLALQVAAEVVTDFPDGAWLCEFAPVTDPDAVWETLAASLAGASRFRAGASRSRCSSIWPRNDCCWCSTTASTSSTRSPARSPRSPNAAPACRCSRRAGKDSRSPGNGSSRCRRSAFRPTTATSTRSWERTRCSCSRIGRAPRRTTSRSPTATRARSGCCAVGSTGSRWRSSWPRRGCDHCHPRISSRVSISGSSSSPRAAAPRSSGIRRCGARSTGPTTCSNRRNVTRWIGCRSSPAAVIWPRPKPCWPSDDLDEFDVVDVLGQLVDKSLVVADDNADGGVRYRLLESIRQYAQERLEAERRHRRGPAPPRRPLRRSSPRPPVPTSAAETSSSGPSVIAPRDRQLPGRARLGRRDTDRPTTRSA